MFYKLIILALLAPAALVAQQVGLWTGHIPFNTVTDIAVNGNTYYCAAQQGMFVFDAANNEISTYSKVNGLNDIGISAIAYNASNEVLVIGYKNSNIDLFSDAGIYNLADIVRANGFIGKKRINHIVTLGDAAYLATGFGIVKVDLVNRVIDETYIFGPNGTEIEVLKLAIDEQNQKIYAATPVGLYFANLNSQLIFFGAWQRDTTLPSAEINQVAVLNGMPVVNKVTAGSVEDSVFVNNGGNWSYLQDQGINKKRDIRVVNNFLAITSTFTVNFLRSDLSLKYIISSAYYGAENFDPLCGYMLPNGTTMLIGNQNSGLIISDDVSNNQRILPNGPYSSRAFRIAAEDGRAYVAPGGITDVWANQFNFQGYFSLDGFEWSHVPTTAIDTVPDVVNVAIDPNDNSRIYIASWSNGVLELKENELVAVWNYQTTGGAIVGPPGDESSPRTGGLCFDESGNLWVTSALSNTPISVLRKDGTWQGYSAGAFGGTSNAYFKVLATSLNQKWLQSRGNGILVMNDESAGNLSFKLITSGEGSGNLPEKTVLSFDEDLDGDIWIGTSGGLVVLYSPQNIFTNGQNFDAQPILFEEDGVVQRLLGEEPVSAIAVDGANKKWLGTQNSGVFYVSADGTETYFHFTEKNSPLLSDVILDIAIDDVTGDVYFATEEGVVSYKGSATRGFDNYTDVYAYPNPVEPGYVGPIYIKGLVTNARIKITDVAGNIVYETIAEGGQASWNGNTLDGEPVASGVYMAYITDDLAERTTVTKILIVR